MAILRDERTDPANLVNGQARYVFRGAGHHLPWPSEAARPLRTPSELLRRQMTCPRAKTSCSSSSTPKSSTTSLPEGRRAVAETLKEIPLRGNGRHPGAAQGAGLVTKLVITAINLFPPRFEPESDRLLRYRGPRAVSGSPRGARCLRNKVFEIRLIAVNRERVWRGKRYGPDRGTPTSTSHPVDFSLVIEALSYARVLDEFDSWHRPAAALSREGRVFRGWRRPSPSSSASSARRRRSSTGRLPSRRQPTASWKPSSKPLEMQQACHPRALHTDHRGLGRRVLCLPVVGVRRQPAQRRDDRDAARDDRRQAGPHGHRRHHPEFDVMDTKTAVPFHQDGPRQCVCWAPSASSAAINRESRRPSPNIGVDLTGVRTLRSLRDAPAAYLRETEQLVGAAEDSLRPPGGERDLAGCRDGLPREVEAGLLSGKVVPHPGAERGRDGEQSCRPDGPRLRPRRPPRHGGGHRRLGAGLQHRQTRDPRGDRSSPSLPTRLPRAKITVEAHDVGPPHPRSQAGDDRRPTTIRGPSTQPSSFAAAASAPVSAPSPASPTGWSIATKKAARRSRRGFYRR